MTVLRVDRVFRHARRSQHRARRATHGRVLRHATGRTPRGTRASAQIGCQAANLRLSRDRHVCHARTIARRLAGRHSFGVPASRVAIALLLVPLAAGCGGTGNAAGDGGATSTSPALTGVQLDQITGEVTAYDPLNDPRLDPGAPAVQRCADRWNGSANAALREQVTHDHVTDRAYVYEMTAEEAAMSIDEPVTAGACALTFADEDGEDIHVRVVPRAGPERHVPVRRRNGRAGDQLHPARERRRRIGRISRVAAMSSASPGRLPRERDGGSSHAQSRSHGRNAQGVLPPRERRGARGLGGARPVLRGLADLPRRARRRIGRDLRRRRERVARGGRLAEQRPRRELGAVQRGPRATAPTT